MLNVRVMTSHCYLKSDIFLLGSRDPSTFKSEICENCFYAADIKNCFDSKCIFKIFDIDCNSEMKQS